MHLGRRLGEHVLIAISITLSSLSLSLSPCHQVDSVLSGLKDDVHKEMMYIKKRMSNRVIVGCRSWMLDSRDSQGTAFSLRN